MPLKHTAFSMGLKQWHLCLARKAASPGGKQAISRTPQTLHRVATSRYSQRRRMHSSIRLAAPAALVSLLQPKQQAAAGILHRCQCGFNLRQQQVHRIASTTTKMTRASMHVAASAVLTNPVEQQSSSGLQDDAGGGDSHAETIVALSSGAGRSAVAVIRVSGPQADDVLRSLLKPGSPLPEPRVAALRSLFDPEDGCLLDRVLVLRFPGPASFTGEDVVEIQGHGGPAVVRSLLATLTRQPGVRLAEAGEFTRQAFLGGKLDLTEVEGIADLLAAETAAQARQALQQTSGMQRRRYEAWRKTLLHCLAHVEAVIDFGDDNDIESGVAGQVLPSAMALRRELESHLRDGQRGELVRDGVRVALVGPPNAGKSTLLNRLAGRDAAIVSSTPGTTRDTLEVALELGGHKVIVTDTAGVRDTADEIEAEGVLRAKAAARDADIVVAVADVSAPALDVPLLDWIAALHSEEPADSSTSGSNSTSDANVSPAEASENSAGCFVPGSETARSALEPAESSSQGDGVSSDGNGILTSNGAGQPSSRGAAIGWTDTAFQQDIIVNGSSAASASGAGSRSQEDLQGQYRKPILVLFNKWDLVSEQPFQLGWIGPCGDESADESAERWLADRLPGPSGMSRNAEHLLGALKQGAGEVSGVLGISASMGAGVDMLLEVLERHVAQAVGSSSAEGNIITRLRHRQHVEECVAALHGYETVSEQLELAAEELRYAARALGKVTGAIDTEHVLDAIFSEFCVGK